MRVSDSPSVDARWALPGQLANADAHAPAGRSGKRTPRDWAVDVTFFLFAALMWLATLAISHDTFVTYSEGGEEIVHSAAAQGLFDIWIDPIIGGTLVLSLWWRRKFPVTLALVAILASTFCITGSGAALVLIFSLALHRPWPVSVPVSLLLVPAILVYERFQPSVEQSPLSAIIFTTLMVVALLAWGIAVRARRQLVLSLRAASEQERREHQMLLTGARRAEREDIAREMHDVLAHRISLLSVHAGALEYRTSQAEAGSAAPLTAAEVHQAVTVIRENAHQALEELREVLTVLRTEEPEQDDSPAGPTETGTAAPQVSIDDLPTLIAEAQAVGQKVHVDIDVPEAHRLRPQAQRTVYRVVQEGLTNARKHAPQAPVNVVLRAVEDEDVKVEITNVVPLTETVSVIPGSGAGLAGLRERVEIEGGTLEARSSGGAFRLTVVLPWRT